MNNKLKILIILIFISILPSCNSKKENIPVINTKASIISSTNLSEVFQKVEMIPLGTANPLISRIFKIIKTKEYLFVGAYQRSGIQVLQFDCYGNYIKQIGSIGHGPGEYFYSMEFTVDTSLNRVYIAAYDQLISFDFDGRFLQKKPVNPRKTYYEDMICIDNQLWIFQQREIPPEANTDEWIILGELVRYNNYLQVVDTIVIRRSFHGINQWVVNADKYCLSNLRDKIYVYYPIYDAEPFLRDTLFELRNLRKIPALKLDFSEILSVDKSINLKNVNLLESFEPIHKIRNMLIYNIYRTHQYIFVEYNKGEYTYNNEQYLFCYDLSHERRYNMKGGFTDDLYNTGIASLKPSDLQQGEFYFVKYGYEVEGIIDGMNESSNPVIFFVKTKE